MSRRHRAAKNMRTQPKQPYFNTSLCSACLGLQLTAAVRAAFPWPGPAASFEDRDDLLAAPGRPDGYLSGAARPDRALSRIQTSGANP
ncbi:MAG: hypothetical protein RL701_7999 [Pseudomonadota bacterium]|jgi:hypothetical protein